MKKGKFLSLICALTLTLSLLMTGCGSSANGKSGSSSSTSKTANTTKQLIFYSAEGFDKDIANAFQKKTGIKVKMIDDSTGPILAKLQAEKSNPQWDVVWFDGSSSMQGLDDQDMLYKDYVPANAANYTDLGNSLKPKDNAYFPVTVTAAGAIAYNTKLVKAPDAPKDWSDLLNPKYKGTFAMNNPSISGPTYPAVFGLMKLQGSITQGEQFFKNLKANGLKVFDTNGPTLTNLEKGNVKYAIAQDSAILKTVQSGQPIKLIYPSSGVSTLSSNIAIDAKAPDLQAAKEFVNYVLSVEGQKVESSADTGDANFQSIIKNAPGKQGIRPNNIKWNVLDPIEGAQRENEIKQWFTQNIVQ